MQNYKKIFIRASGDAFFSYFCSAMEKIVEQAVAALRSGKTLLYPTDTIWGIGCDARNGEAVEKLYAIKERDHSKSMIILVESGKWKVESDGRPTTYILPKEIWQGEMGLEVADNLAAADGRLGIRMPKHPFCQAVIKGLGAPIVSTSANLSGHPSPQNYEEIEEELRRRIDYCVPPLAEFLSGETRGSRIVKLNPDGSQTILRP